MWFISRLRDTVGESGPRWEVISRRRKMRNNTAKYMYCIQRSKWRMPGRYIPIKHCQVSKRANVSLLTYCSPHTHQQTSHKRITRPCMEDLFSEYGYSQITCLPNVQVLHSHIPTSRTWLAHEWLRSIPSPSPNMYYLLTDQ
jgi:hypothetical protein